MDLARLTRYLAVAACLLMLLPSLAGRPAAAAAGVVGTYSAADNGQGCWGGGPLLADFTLGGGAHCSFGNGTDVAGTALLMK
jgi:hypothetical protein